MYNPPESKPPGRELLIKTTNNYTQKEAKSQFTLKVQSSISNCTFKC